MHYQQYQIEDGRVNPTKTSKLMGRILLYVPRHQEEDPHIHMDITNHKLSSYTEGKRHGH